MLAKLIPVDGSQPFVITRDVTIVGRRRSDCDMVINHHGVSKLHCAIAKTDGLLFVRDLGSTNGTKVNGQRVMRGALLPGDELAFGNTKFRVHLGPGDPSGISDRTEAMVAYTPPPGREQPLMELQERMESDSDIRLVSPEEIEPEA
ncbi:MAG: FHA domain-containing protein [Planctomycetaceae bacterium]|nr:FHA domain-containing protein [Planctomycetaceae bacterium]